jgi:enoyl-CoA hydratase/carnithine racemase
VTPALFAVTRHDGGVASLRIATDEEPYLGLRWVEGFSRALSAVSADDAVRVVILEGGERYFSAGASLEALTKGGGSDPFPSYTSRAVRALLASPLPVVAAAAGHAIGGGLLVALWSEIAFLAEESLYGANFMQLGFTPGMGATHAIPGAFGEPLGRELLFSGRLLTGREIREARCPLSHAVLPRAQVTQRALSMAREIAGAPRESIVLLKQQLAARRREAFERVVHAENSAQARVFADPATLDEIVRRYPAHGRDEHP